MTVPDFGKAAMAYGRWRQGFPKAFFDQLAGFGIGMPGQDVLDIGTGTGLMARGLARRGCRVTGLDPSDALLAISREAAEAAGLAITHVQGTAEDTEQQDAAFDIVTAATCWHWFDRAAAATECLRVLRPGGRLVIAHQDWLRREGNVIDLTLETIARWSPPSKGGVWTFQYPDWLFELTDAGFAGYRLFGFPVELVYSHEAWIGRIVASAHIGPKLSAADQALFCADLETGLAGSFPDPMPVSHRIFAIVLDHPQEPI